MTNEPDGGATDGLVRREHREAIATAAGSAGPNEAEGVSPEVVSSDDADPAEDTEGEAKPKAKSSRRNLIEWVVVIGGAVIIAVLVRLFVFQTFWIPSASMSPTLIKDDRVIVNKLSYKMHDIHRGDVVVFERPANEPSNIKDLIKRVIALPGEHISILNDSVFVNGRKLDEPYTHGLPTVAMVGCGTGDVAGIDTVKGLLIPKNHVFVMGDNRINSTDGRCFGPIDEHLVVGRAFVIMWPPNRAGGL